VFLPVTMATTDALLDPLRIPRQVVVYDKRAKLKMMPSAPASVAIMICPCSRK
jgi:hypothetical protein